MADDPPPGVPEWVVTYGDMMSLLLTFFIMLVSISEIKGDKKYQKIVEAIMQHLGYLGSPEAPPGDGFPLSGMIEKLSTLGGVSEKKGKGGVKQPGAPGEDLRVFKGREGTAVVLGGALVFGPGEAAVRPSIEPILTGIANQVAGKPNKLEICGYASQPAATQTGSDPSPPSTPAGQRLDVATMDRNDPLTLSYRRARSVSESLMRAGVRPERIRLVAIGDREPRTANVEPEEKPADRVEVHVLDAFTEDFVGQRQAAP